MENNNMETNSINCAIIKIITSYIIILYTFKQECWFGGGCLESSEMESGSWRDCRYSGINQTTPVYRINADQNWID